MNIKKTVIIKNPFICKKLRTMNENNLSNIILESIYQFGPLAVPEIKYLLKNYFSWKIKLGVETLFKLKNYDISKYLNKLTETRKIREYLCESGYSSRYGISKLPFTSEYPLKLNLKIKLKKCSECSSWIIEYHNKKRHLFYFSCKKRDEIDDGNILFIRYNNKYFTIYNNLFLGVFEEGILRFPFRDYSKKKPELFLAMDIINKKQKSDEFYSLKMNFEEVII